MRMKKKTDYFFIIFFEIQNMDQRQDQVFERLTKLNVSFESGIIGLKPEEVKRIFPDVCPGEHIDQSVLQYYLLLGMQDLALEQQTRLKTMNQVIDQINELQTKVLDQGNELKTLKEQVESKAKEFEAKTLIYESDLKEMEGRLNYIGSETGKLGLLHSELTEMHRKEKKKNDKRFEHLTGMVETIAQRMQQAREQDRSFIQGISLRR
jgi:flagellar hook-basal body complex protein FliE